MSNLLGTLNELLKDVTIFVEISEGDVGSLIIVKRSDKMAATGAIEWAKNIWFNHEGSDERVDMLADQISFRLEEMGIEHLMLDFDEC